jgi:hypothetical protein
MSNQVELKPGQTLEILTEESSKNGITTRSSQLVSHSKLLELLNQKESKRGRSRKSVTAGSKYSRAVSLASRALVTNTWSTGAPINREKIIQTLLDKAPVDVNGITKKAWGSLVSMTMSPSSFNLSATEQLQIKKLYERLFSLQSN